MADIPRLTLTKETMIDFKALGAKAAADGADMTKTTTGGGDYKPPAAGPALARFVGYVEIGKHNRKFKGVPTVVDQVQLIFELVGKRHPPTEVNGVLIPQRVTITEKISNNVKANFVKLFNRMNYKQDAQHMVQLLGNGYKVEVVHDKWTGSDGKERTDVTFRKGGEYTVAPPRKEDEDSETGWVDIEVPKHISELRCFIWEQADMAQWASLFIDGEYPERKDESGKVTAKAKSKNVLQDKIKSSLNFAGSPMHTLLLAGGHKIDIPDVGEDEDERSEGNGGQQTSNQTGASGTSGEAAAPLTTSHSDDALGGIV